MTTGQPALPLGTGTTTRSAVPRARFGRPSWVAAAVTAAIVAITLTGKSAEQARFTPLASNRP